MISSYRIKWHIPKNIGYFISNNKTGSSKGIYESANFSTKVGEDIKLVNSNIIELKKQLNLKHISFMNQTHSNIVLETNSQNEILNCDGIYTLDKLASCAVLTADCIPILITEKKGSLIGCVHAGWKGLKSKVIENFFDKLSAIKREDFRVLLGPCISKERYVVNDDVFMHLSKYTKRFIKKDSESYYMDLRYIAYDILSDLGISDVTISKACTHNDEFYSYRKNKVTGRFISLIWFNK